MTKQEKFLEKAKAKFPQFDYSKVEYVRNDIPVTIICPIHGEFEKKPTQFLISKHGCTKCANEGGVKNRRKTLEQFISEANAVWGNKYTYEKVNYIDANTKVTITCPIHGDFEIRPSDFLRKHGCPKCKGDHQKNLNKQIHGDTLEEFIEKARKVHGDKYDYSKVNYINSRTKVEIICSKHGSFWQLPNHHIQGSGCPYCKKSLGEDFVSKILSKYNYIFEEQYKINVKSRKIYIDFCVKKDNNIYFIEYQGEQHFKSVEHFGGIDNFEDQILRDFTLREYCYDNKIPLLELCYYHNKNEIEEKIKKFLDYNDNTKENSI